MTALGSFAEIAVRAGRLRICETYMLLAVPHDGGTTSEGERQSRRSARRLLSFADNLKTGISSLAR